MVRSNRGRDIGRYTRRAVGSANLMWKRSAFSKYLLAILPVGTALCAIFPSIQTLAGRLSFTVRRHNFNKDSLTRARAVRRTRLSPAPPPHDWLIIWAGFCTGQMTYLLWNHVQVE